MCFQCDHETKFASEDPTLEMRASMAALGRGPEPITRMTCPVCDRVHLARVRYASTVNSVGKSYWADARARYRAHNGLAPEAACASAQIANKSRNDRDCASRNEHG